MKLIEVKNAAFSYEGRVVAENISLTVNSGDYLCIVGENGSGKSTLAKGIVGLKEPCSGTVEYSKSFSKKSVGFIPQQTDYQMNFPATVMEVVLSGTGGFFYKSKEKEKAKENLRLLGIEELEKRSYRELSGGQRQRVLLARALCAARQLLVLDEPTAGLDPIVTEEMYDIIRKINRERDCAIIMISHDIESALMNARTILHLDHFPLFSGTVEEYRQSELFKSLSGVMYNGNI